MITSALSIVLAVLMIAINNASGKREMHPFTKKLIFGWLARLVCMGDIVKAYTLNKVNDACNADDKKPSASKRWATVRSLTISQDTKPCPNDAKVRDVAIKSITRQKAEDRFVQLLQEKRSKRERREAEEERIERNKQQWVLASRIIDKVLMVLYLILYVILTVTCIGILPNLPKVDQLMDGTPSGGFSS